MNKMNVVKALYYQLNVMGYHPIIGGTTALYLRRVATKFDDLVIILNKREYDDLTLPYEEVKDKRVEGDIDCKHYSFYGLDIKLIPNPFDRGLECTLVDDILCLTVGEVNQVRRWIVKTLKDSHQFEVSDEHVMKWIKKLILY